MSDIVERLRFLSAQNRDSRHLKMAYAMDDAADLITSLRANIDRLTSNPADHRYWEGRYRDEKAENERLRKSLEFYANPEIYKPHPHGIGFDRRDLSFHAKAALNASSNGGAE
ncbi:hypothetical protein AB3480_00730 [Rhizobium mongolense]|uniref:hypothetical protein n=1 Tax=Rhizobium mongolense TaxID=57676 RepID=UPI0034A3DFAA